MRSFILFFSLFFIVKESFSTHLMGGEVSYEYLGPVSGNNYRYRITVKTYTNCGPSSQVPFPEGSINIHIYNETANPNDDKPWQTTVTAPLVDSTKITPELPNNCTVGQNSCIYKGVYVIEVDLPAMPGGNFSNGYHVYYDRCCRNGSIVNLNSPGTQGMVFYAFIPTPVIQNNSPVFSDAPIPFLCAGDTTGILNTATDPDGDLLVFSFVDPYKGYSNQFQPLPPAPNPLGWPIPTVNWAVGYNKNNPFGINGYAYINAFTGYTEYMSPNTGNYVVAVEIKEYRAGNLIGITRRDLQLLVVNCPPNSEPNLTSQNSNQPSYTIEEGDSICFPIEFIDPNGDSLTVTSSGDIFNSSIVNPPAIINTPVSGDSIAAANFCWNTACGQAQSLPYLFTVEAVDNGCPPKSTPIVFSITVNPFQGASSINGPNIVCPLDTQKYYVTNIPGATFNWSAINGNVISGQGSDTVSIVWGNFTNGQVIVNTTSQFGCNDGPVTLNISIKQVQADAGNDTLICFGDTVKIGGNPTGAQHSTFNWSNSQFLNDNTNPNPDAFPDSTIDFIVTVTDTLVGCSINDTVKVTVAKPQINTNNNNIYLCLGDSVQLFVSGANNYTWTPSQWLSNDSIENPWASPDSTITYQVIGTDSNNCSAYDSVTINVIRIVLANAGNDFTICFGDTITIGGSPAGDTSSTFLWTPFSNLNDSSLPNPLAYPNITTNYILTVTDSFGCKGYDTVLITVNPLPVISISNDTSICFGDTIQIMATGGNSFIWLPNQFISDTSISNPLVFPDSSISYIVAVQDSNNCTNYDTIDIVVNMLPKVMAQDLWLCPGDTNQLNATGASSYQWYPSYGLSDTSISNPLVWTDSTINYSVMGIDSNLCKNVDTVKVTVNAQVPTEAGNSLSICFGDSTLIGGSPTAPNGSSFLWYPDSSLSDSSVANPYAKPLIDTWYYVVTSNDTCTGLDSVLVKVNPLPLADAGANTQICINDSTQLNASGGVKYQWTPNQYLSNDTIPNPYAFPNDTIIYYVTVTDTNNCMNTDSVSVIVNPLPLADAGANTQICINDSTQLNASGGVKYQWTPNQYLSNDTIPNPYAFPNDTIIYYVTVTDTNNCSSNDSIVVIVNPLPNADAGNDKTICLNDSVQLNASGGINYQWTPPINISNDTIANPYVFPLNSVVYFVNVIDSNGCSNIDSVIVKVNSLPAVDAGPNLQVCIGDSSQLLASGASKYQWTPSYGLSNDTISNPYVFVQDTTVYYLTGLDSNNCKNTDSVIVYVNPLPVINLTKEIHKCKNDTVMIVASGASSYQWYPNIDISNTSISNPLVYPDSDITYYVFATDTNLCKNTDSILVTVFRISAISDSSVCEGGSINLWANSVTPANYIWLPDTFLNQNNIPNPVSTPQENINYTVIATDTSGCVDSSNVFLRVLNKPSSSFSFTLEPACNGIEASFTNSSNNADSYTWIFGDGDTSNEKNPVHIFLYSNSYTITLLSHNGLCSDTITQNINAGNFSDYLDWEIPNVFSPNGDGINDEFTVNVSGDLKGCMHLQIFNRWGVKVYDSDFPYWSGKTQYGKDVPEGVYYYIITVNGIEEKGSINLFR